MTLVPMCLELIENNPTTGDTVMSIARGTGANTFSGSVSINNEAASGYGALEFGGNTGAFIDLKTPFSDDYDSRRRN